VYNLIFYEGIYHLKIPIIIMSLIKWPSVEPLIENTKKKRKSVDKN